MRRLLAAFGRDALRVELQRPLAAPRPRAEPRAGGARRAARRRDRRDRQRPRAHAPSARCLQDAFVAIREHTTLDASEPLRRGNHAHVLTTPQAMAARFADHPEAVAETERARRALTFDLTERPRLPLSGRRGRRRRAARSPRSARRASTSATRAGSPHRAEAQGAPGGGAARHRRARPRGLLRPAPRHARARARGRRRGARARGQRARAAAARPRPRLERLVDRLPPHGPQPRRPDRQQAPARALPQRGAHRAAGHRPRLPARHPRGPDPAHPRASTAASARRSSRPSRPTARAARSASSARRSGLPPGEIERVARGSEGWSSRDVDRDIDTALGRGAADRAAGRGSRGWPPRRRACRAISPSTPAG